MQSALVTLDNWSIPIFLLEIAARRCRFCIEVSSKHSVGLFTTQANLDNLISWLSLILHVPISADNGLSKFACQLCWDSRKNLEEKLAAKRSVVRVLYQCARYVTGIVWRNLALISPNQAFSTSKRPNYTSGGAGVSLAAMNAQPPSKRPTVSHTLFPQGTKYLKAYINLLHTKKTKSEKEQDSRITAGTYRIVGNFCMVLIFTYFACAFCMRK